MTAHDHREFVQGCFRCDLSSDELVLSPPQKRTLSAKDRAARTIPQDVIDRFWRRKNEQKGEGDEPA